MATPLIEYNQKVADYTITIQSIPFKDFLNACLGDTKFTASNLTIAGIIIVPLTDPDPSIGPNYFHTYGVRIKAVAWDLVNLGSLVIGNFDFDIISNNAAVTSRPIPSTQASLIFNQTWQTVYTDTLRFYKITGGPHGTPLEAFAPEFDLVYIDIDKFCELAGIRFAAGNFDMWETGNYYQTNPAAIDRGFQISRASFDFDYNIYTPTTTTPVELGKARTLKFNPYPVPPLLSVASRPTVAYQLGIPCPPIWHDGLQSQMVARVMSQAIEDKLIPQEPRLSPELPPAQPTTFWDAFRGSIWVKGMSFILLALIAILVFLLSKTN